jgi:regulator of replication initiation timing
VFADLRPQDYAIVAKTDSDGFPICKLNLFSLKPEKKNFILCMKVKKAEAGDRKTEYDEIYTGYLDGSIICNKIYGDSLVKTTEIWKGEEIFDFSR